VPSWAAIGTALFGPLVLALFAKALHLSEQPGDTAKHFAAGAGLAFGALVVQGYVFTHFDSSIPGRYRLMVEAFAFIALTEEVVKIAQITEAARRKATSLRDTIAIGIVISAGFAGAENVIYLFRYAHDVESLLLLRTLTANPMHLATGVVASYFIHSAIEDEQRLHHLAVAMLIATAVHGAYDYLLLSSRGRSYAFVFVLCFVVAWAWRIIGSHPNPRSSDNGDCMTQQSRAGKGISSSRPGK
jgi:RsiW-degrading membrane proteinase PrsW (M82 family)